MRKMMLLLVLVFGCIAVWAQTASDILKSNNVLAYTHNGAAYLMDINTGKEVRIPSAKGVTQLVWDSSGTRLFGFGYGTPTGETSKHAYFTEFQLPSLTEKAILDEKMSDWDLVNMEIELGSDNRIYVYECIEEYDDDDYEGYYPYYEWYVYKYYDLGANALTDMKPGEVSTKKYQPAYIKEAVTEGHGIKNDSVLDGDIKHYELFISDNPKTDNPSYKRLTKVNFEQFKKSFNGDKIDFIPSPNDKLILYAYHYYISDPGTDNSYAMLISRDGKKSMFVADDAPINYSEEIFWTTDSKLVYCGRADRQADKLQLTVINQDFTSKALKTFDLKDRPKLSYRYK